MLTPGARSGLGWPRSLLAIKAKRVDYYLPGTVANVDVPCPFRVVPAGLKREIVLRGSSEGRGDRAAPAGDFAWYRSPDRLGMCSNASSVLLWAGE